MNSTLRLSQQEILDYRRGKMGISAVPGSGKTFTLSLLATDLVARGDLGEDQEVLIVTLVNSAVDNFSMRIGKRLQEIGLLPNIGYRVRTLHGLAHDIVRESPGMAGLEERFQIVDEREATLIRKDAAQTWMQANPECLDVYLPADINDNRRDAIRRKQLPELVEEIALAFIRSAKNHRLTPEDLRHHLEEQPAPLPLAEIGWGIYASYQRALNYRGAVDFDDLIRLAFDLLKCDESLLERMRNRWPFILEDEAQDSSLLQEEILRLLVGDGGNWVRVGDPNQAIFETFTTASPRYLREFIANEAEFPRELPVSGRSQPSIIALANQLITWTNQAHIEPAVRDALTTPFIQAAPTGDPQPNPPDNPEGVMLINQKFSPEEEVQFVAKDLDNWLSQINETPAEEKPTIAILVPRNQRGIEIIDALKKRGIEYIEFLASTSPTRAAAGVLGNVLNYLSDPKPAKLANVYAVWRREYRANRDRQTLYKRVIELIKKCHNIEDYLTPQKEQEWLASLHDEEEAVTGELVQFRQKVQRWQNTILLPIDQMILTLAQELFTEPSDLALAYNLSLVLRRARQAHPEYRLPELTNELGVIARNERRFLGFSKDDTGFDPEKHRGRVVITTMHKAKGLEWDRVYLMSVNNYDFPSAQPYDEYISEKWFIRDQLNLQSETLAQLKTALTTGEYDWYTEGEATIQARLDYVRERLRLLYVGITRAKKELIITWNTGRKGETQPTLAFVALLGWWNENMAPSTN